MTKYLSACLLVLFIGSAQADPLLTNLGQVREDAKPSPFDNGNGKAIDFKINGERPFELSGIVLRLKLTKDSRPQLSLLENAAASEPVRVPLNHAAGLDEPWDAEAWPLTALNIAGREGTIDVEFVPNEPRTLRPGSTYRVALSTKTPQDKMLWLSGDLPQREDKKAQHSGQVYGQGRPATWNVRSQVINLYEIRGRWLHQGGEGQASAKPKPPTHNYAQFSGIYPHLAMFNTRKAGECGIGAVVNWADRLWAVTYSPGATLGSPDKLFQIDRDQHIYVHPESVGGTPANRMIHEESGQLLIGPYLIDEDRRVRVIPPRKMPGRLTGTARHLTDPGNKVYYASMEEAFYEVDVHTLEVTQIHGDTRVTRSKGFAHGNHGKGLYSGQGRVIYSNNGGHGHNGNHIRKLNQDFKEVGSLNQWDGKAWSEVHRTGFLDVSGPGGIRGNRNPATDPVWAIGWDYRSVILKVLDKGKWHTYRLPKASHTMDGPHGFNTEWPRMGEIGSDTERLIYVHGMFWKLPTKFSTSQADGLRPRSTYLKMVSDSTHWGDRIVFACNDLSNELQAIRLNSRKIRGNLTPSISHANLWFVEPDQIDDFGIPIGRGSVWNHDAVTAGKPSDAFQFGGWGKRLVHLSHGTKEAVRFTMELDRSGTGEWEPWKAVEVAADGYLPVSLANAPEAEWIRLRANKDAENVFAIFHYANDDRRETSAAPLFDGIARGEEEALGGMVRIKGTDGAPLAYATVDNYYEMGTDMRMRPVDDPAAAEALREIAAFPERGEGPGSLSADAASVIYIDEEDGKRYRLPRGSEEFQFEGLSRIDREVCRERNLFNAYGTFFELPYRNAGGFALIRPVTTHNRRIKDYCSWRGLFVMTGIDKKNQNNRIIRSGDGKAAVWLGAVDDLWKFGKAVGVGGPWQDTAVKAGEPSDQYLMTGYDKKTLTLSHKSNDEVTITVEVDITGYGDWKTYRSFKVPKGKSATHCFPNDFNAYWVRTTSDTVTTATAQLIYE